MVLRRPSLLIRFFYHFKKVDYTFHSLKSYYKHEGHRLKFEELSDFVYKTFMFRNITYLHRNEGDQVAPTSIGKAETLLVRELPITKKGIVSVGDLVVLKDPEKEGNYLVRRLAAVEGYEMVPTDYKEEPFVLEKDQCWVEAENKCLKPTDSGLFGPVHMTDIVGRVIYCMRTCEDHYKLEIVENSHSSRLDDWSVAVVEFDIGKMLDHHLA